MSRWADRLKNLESAPQGTGKGGKSPFAGSAGCQDGAFSNNHTPFAGSAGTPSPTFENIAYHDHGAVIREGQAQILSPSPSGNDIEAANSERILVTAYTPSGLPMLVEADNPAHAEWIVRANPPPVSQAQPRTYAPKPFTGVLRNTGIPADLLALAVRYCSEVCGDGEGAIEWMLSDLQAVPDDWSWWRGYFMERLAIPEAVMCAECRYCADTGSGLGRCQKGVAAPGASGLWWMTDLHPCIQFSANQEATP